MLKESRKLKSPMQSKPTGITSRLGMCLGGLLNAAPAIHRLHLKVTGPGSYAQHMALNELYEALPDLVDTVAEGWQGAAEELLELSSDHVYDFPTVNSALEFMRMKSEKITELQGMIPYSEVVNNMDLIKDALNTAKYKLIFLK